MDFGAFLMKGSMAFLDKCRTTIDRSIEVQLMKRLAGDMEHLHSTLPEEYHFKFAHSSVWSK